MKLSIKTLVLSLSLLSCGSVFAASSAQTQPVMDKDGAFVHMDVAQVLSDTTSGNPCGVEKAKLVYLNHQGIKHELDYRIDGECPEQN